MRIVNRILGAIAGAVLGLLLLVILFYAIHFFMGLFGASRVRFRIPVFLIFLPIIGMWLGLKHGPDVSDALIGSSTSAVEHLSGNRLGRLALVGPALWLISVIGYTLLFEPYGSYMRDRDYLHLAKVITFPITLLWLSIWAAQFVLNGPNKEE